MNKETAYCLGFIWADGYLWSKPSKHQYKVMIEIIKTDYDILLPIFLLYHKGGTTYRHRPNRQPQGRFEFSHKKHFEQLVQWGYLSKSIQSPSLNHIPKNVLHYWWRGYIDGDGCYYKHSTNSLKQFTIGSSYEQDWSTTQDWLRLLHVKYSVSRRIHSNSKSSIIRVCSKKGITSIFEYVYPNRIFDGIGLRRKYDKGLTIVD